MALYSGSLSGKGSDQFIGLEKALMNLNKEIQKIESRTEDGMFEAGQAIKNDAVDRAPEVLQNLKRSAFVVGDKKEDSRADFIGFYFDTAEYRTDHKRAIARAKEAIRKGGQKAVHFGFSIKYAMYVHENPRAGKTGGVSPKGRKYPEGTYSTTGNWKFLEYAIRRNIRRAKTIIINRAKKA